MVTKQKFMQGLCAGTGFTVINGVGMRKQYNCGVVKVSLQVDCHSKAYGVLVQIFTPPGNGPIDKQTFLFDDYLLEDESASVCSVKGYNWVGTEPTRASIDLMFEAINSYVRFFAFGG